MKDIMVDIETLSTDSNGVIVSISAVQFDRKTGELGEEFEVGININEQVAKGAILDGDTIIWWLGQPKEAQNSLLAIEYIAVNDALAKFNGWIGSMYPQWAEVKNVNLWGNSNSFDCTMIRNLYSRHNMKFILPYWSDKDVRTAVELLGRDNRYYEFKGIKHNGLADCKHQINYIGA